MRAAVLLAGLATTLACAAQLAVAVGSVELRDRVGVLIRPHAALGCCLCGLGLLARLLLGGHRRGRWPCRAAAGFTVAMALDDLWHLAARCRLPIGPGPWCAPGAVQGGRMAPLAATMLIVAGAGLWARGGKRPLGSLGAVVASSWAAAAVTGYYVCAYAYGKAPPGASNLGQMVLPLASVCLLLLHSALLCSCLPERLVGEITGPLLGARVARRLLLFGPACILVFGLLRIQMQRWGWMDLEEGTAALVLVLLAGFLVFCWHHARLVNRAIAAQMRAVAEMQAISERHAAVSRDHAEARARLDSVLQAAVDYAIIGTDAQGTITVFSDGAARMLGYTAEEMIGRATPERFHDAAEVAACAAELGVAADMSMFFTLASRATSDTREWTYLHRSGARVPVSMSVAGLRDASGALVGLVGVARDLIAVKRSEQLRQNILAVSQELLCVADAEGRLHHTNPAFARIVGYSRDEVEGRPFLDFVHPDDVARTQASCADAACGLPLHRFENRWRHRDGNYRWISWDCSPSDANGSLYASGWDITDDKARASEAARQAEFEQQLIGIVSHDLRNPVGVIALTAASMARHHSLPQAISRMVARVARTSARAERMLHDLLDFTQARKGGLRVHARLVDLDDSLDEVLDEARLLHPNTPVTLHRWARGQLHVDPDRIAQAVANLVSNALHYSPRGTPVTVSLAAPDGTLNISVHNGGPPIDPALMPRLFYPMQRGAQGEATTSHRRSVGLGLYIVDQIARAHRGRVGVRSSAADGTRFELILPDALPQQAQLAASATPVPAAGMGRS